MASLGARIRSCLSSVNWFNAAMLKEILGVADDPPAKRRWFHDDFFDLFVWQSEGEVTLFQLCYGADATERALVWDKSRGFFHDGPPGSQDDKNGRASCRERS